MIKVLLIDDSEIIRLAIKKYLSKKNDIAVVACSLEQATTVLNSKSFDVVLTEFFLKIDGDGIHLIKYIKSTYPEVKVLGYSDNATENNENLMIKTGALGYLDKSLSIKQMREAIITVMKL